MSDTENPHIYSTQKELAFNAWQTAQHRGDQNDKYGLAWEAFEGWWNGRDFSYFTNLRQLMRAAWNFSSNETESQLTSPEDQKAFHDWWQAILAAGSVLDK